MSYVGQSFPPAWLPDGVLAIAKYPFEPEEPGDEDDGSDDEYIVKVAGRFKRVYHNSFNDSAEWFDYNPIMFDTMTMWVVAESLSGNENPYHLEAWLVLQHAGVVALATDSPANAEPTT